MNLSNEQKDQYQPQILLPQVGEAGQEKLLAAKILIVGLGGLGSPVSQYLVRAGIGTIGIVDSDKVELNNLHRQILYSSADIGQAKVEAAKNYLNKVNPQTKIIPYRFRLSKENIEPIVKDYDLVVDGVDNLETRYLINEVCVRQNKIFIHGACFQFEGQVSVIKPGQGPCYKCMFPDLPPKGAILSSRQAGIIGTLPGVIGMLQANEVLKVVLEMGNPLIGKLLFYNALTAQFRHVKMGRRSTCEICNLD